MAHMFFPAADDAAAARPARKAPMSILAGNDHLAKHAMLLQYAYNAALRGCRSLVIARQRPSPDVPLPGAFVFPASV